MRQWLFPVLLAGCLFAGRSAIAQAGEAAGRSTTAEDRLPGIVFVSGDICNPDPTKDGRRSTLYWREGYIYHRATTIDPMERTITPTRPGRNLFTLIPAEPAGKVTRITHMRDGQVFDPEPSYDGTKILFSMRRDGEDWFHLCEINVDGSQPVQLTDGPFNDVSGVYLADGRIVFVSDRAGYLEEYHEERTETLWIMNGDGTGVEQLTFDPGTVYDPTVLGDGRICYSYWDDFLLNVPPVDKHETYLMTVRPDGTEETHLFGVRQYRFFNRERHSGSSLTQPGQLPDGTMLVLSEMGPSILDPRQGMDVAQALWPVFPGTTTIQLGGASHRVHLSPTGSRSTPYPLPDGCFLFSATLPGARDLGVYLCDPKTRQVQLVFNDPDSSEYDARPIRLPRPEPVILPPKRSFADAAQSRKRKPSRTRPNPRVGASPRLRVPVTGRARFVVVNARRSDNPEHERALRRARYFRVVESMHTAVTSSSHTNLETRILGVVPIPFDETVYFEAPADTPLFLDALDAAGHRVLFDWNYAVTSVPIGSKQPLMEMSSLTARPGEVKACHGCHSAQEEAAFSGPPRQLAREPIQVRRDLTDILYRRNEPDEYRARARIGEAPKYHPWLTNADPDLRRRACEMLMAIEDGARQDAPVIATLLADESVEVRRAAALALTRLGTLEEAAALLRALKDTDWQVRFHASAALEAITACAPVVDEDRVAPQKFYERLFSKAGGPQALKKLIGRGPDALAALSGQSDLDFRSRWFEAAGRLGRPAGERTRQVVRKALSVPLPPPTKFQPRVGYQHYKLEVKPPDLAAIRAAGWIRDVPAVPLLTGWLARPEYNYHATEAALALGRIGTNEAVEALWQALRNEVPNRKPYIGRYYQHGPRPEEYALLRGLILARAAPKLEDVPLIIAMLPGTFLEKPRYEDRLRPETQRVLLGRLLLEKAGLRKRAVALLVAALRTDSPPDSDPLYGQLVKGINLERPFSEHGRPFPVVKQIEPEQALWLLGCLTVDAPEVPQELILPYLTSGNPRERIDAAVLLNRLGLSQKGAELLAAEIAKPYTFREIWSIGKGVRDPNFRDKCYMVMALAHHTGRVDQLKPFADPQTRYRDIRYGLALGLGYRDKPDGVALLVELATRDPIGVVRRQARESLRAIQETQRLAGNTVPDIDLPDSMPFEGWYPPRRLHWPAPVRVVKVSGTIRQPQTRGLDELKQAVAEALNPDRYRNLNNTNNQAPGATRMMIRGAADVAQAIEELSARFPQAAKPVLRRLLDSPYPFAHYLALEQLTQGGHPELDAVLIAKLDVYAKSVDTVGVFWTCEALARRGVQAAIPRLARFTQPGNPPAPPRPPKRWPVWPVGPLIPRSNAC